MFDERLPNFAAVKGVSITQLYYYGLIERRKHYTLAVKGVSITQLYYYGLIEKVVTSYNSLKEELSGIAKGIIYDIKYVR